MENTALIQSCILLKTTDKTYQELVLTHFDNV